MSEGQTYITGIERAFRKTFGRGLSFRADLERRGSPAWTSLRHVEFLIALEKEFGLRFDGADATDMVDIRSVLDTVGKKLGKVS
jgi:hypothetical protein